MQYLYKLDAHATASYFVLYGMFFDNYDTLVDQGSAWMLYWSNICDVIVVVGDYDSAAANEDLHASLNKLCISMIGAALDTGINDQLW